MSVLNQCGEEAAECPLCMEHLEVDDLNFFPCTCGYQICRFCWHRIRTDENGLCPACRKAYPENPADFRPLSSAEVQKLKSEKRQKDQQRKQKVTESRQHLATVRVVQHNLVFVVGLPPRLADGEMLKRHEYFGKFGKILKVVINPSNSYAGVQGPSASAYVTYTRREDCLRAIAAVNNISVDGRLLKTSLGTTKYCSNFLKNQSCQKPECMYLHEIGDQEASFTKDDMQQGKHQEYERKLHEQLQNQTRDTSTIGIPMASNIINSNNNIENWPSLQDDEGSGSSSTSSSPAPSSNSPKPLEEQETDQKYESKGKEASPMHQQAPSPTSSTSSLSGGPSPSTMQQSQSLSSSSSSISEDILQHSAPKAHVAMHNIQSQLAAQTATFPQSNQSVLYQGVQPSREAMQQNLMPLLNSFNWESAFGNDQPQAKTNTRVHSDIEDDLGFDPFAETQKALEELIKTEQQQQEVRQQQFLQQQQQQMRQAPVAPFRPPEHSFHNRFSTPPPGFSSVPFREPIPATSSKILSLLNDHSHREVQDTSSFNLTHWRNILPNIGTGSSNYGSEMMQRQQLQQTQQRDWHNDWTVMDPAIVAASASPRMTVDNSWNRNMDGPSNYQRSMNSLGWSDSVASGAPSTAPPPGFSHPFNMLSRGGQPSAMDSELKSMLHQLH